MNDHDTPLPGLPHETRRFAVIGSPGPATGQANVAFAISGASGKIMRRLLRDVASDRELGDVTTLTGSSVTDLIEGEPSAAASED